jgi:hypothetical protein
MIRLQRLTSEADLARFGAAYMGNGGFPLPAEYLRRAVVYGLVNRGRLCGGFIVNDSPPFRALNDMAPEDFARTLAELDPEHTFEVMCYWLLPEYRKGVRSTFCWVLMMATIARSPKRDLLLCTVSRRLRDVYLAPGVRLIYDGVILRPRQEPLPKYVILLRPKTIALGGFVLRVAQRHLGLSGAHGAGARST